MTAQTRLLRRPVRPSPLHEPTRPALRVPPLPVTVELPPLVLACRAARGSRALGLLEGLGTGDRADARVLLKNLEAAGSQERHRALSLAFGVRPDADERLSLLAHEVPHALRSELLGLLPRAHRPAFPSGAAPSRDPGGRLLRILAARLLTEAMR